MNDLTTKHPVVINVTADTELKKLDPMVAQRLAMRMRGGAGRPGGGGGAPGGGNGGGGGAPAAGANGGEGGGGGRMGGAGGGDPQQLLARAPSVQLKDFTKGSAVILVATEGTTPGTVTAVTVVGGVEPMLQASASGSQDFLSSAWSLGGGGGGGGDMGGGGGGGEGGP